MSPHGIVHQQRFRSLIDICEELLLQFVVVPGTAVSALESTSLRRIPVSTKLSSAASSSAASSSVSTLAESPSPSQAREERGRRMSQASLVRSSASTPSFRSRDGILPQHLRTDNGGNVRVVVRVRAFLPRGMYIFLSTYMYTAT